MTKCGVLNPLLLLATGLFIASLVLDGAAAYRRAPMVTLPALVRDVWRLFRPNLYTAQGQAWRRAALAANLLWAIIFLVAGLVLFYYPNSGALDQCFIAPPN